MSDYEPSYYEIALTNRQVMVAFVILLSCLLGTFFAGVWVGRSEAEPGAAPAADRQAANGPGVEELDFFAGGELGASDDEPEPPGALPDPVAARAEREARRVEAPAAVVPPADDAEAGEVVPAGGGEQPPAGTAPGPVAASPVASAPPGPDAPPATAPAAGEGAVIQVFSSGDRDQAERVVERLRNGGERPFLSPVEVEGQTMYRVRLGPYRDRAEATRVAERVRRGYGLETWITQ